MSTTSDNTPPKATGIKPLQTISYSAKNKEWRKQNLEYFINSANFRISTKTTTSPSRLDNIQTWYNIYNNKIDENLFNYVTNPLNSEDEKFKKFPARIRPYNIIRPTIDLLIGEWSKRPFRFDVVNTDGDGVMNSYLDAKYETFKNNVTKRFVAELERAKGEPIKPEEIPDPATVIDDLNTNYKDLIALKGYKGLKMLEFDLKLKETFKDMFKDWLIAGDVASLKGVRRKDIDYQRLSPMWVEVDKSPHVRNYEDGSHAVAKFRVTVADVVDMFYDELKETHLKDIETDEDTHRRGLFSLFSLTTSEKGQLADQVDKLDLYYVTWKSRKKIGFLEYNDPITGEPLTAEVDEAYIVDKEAGETIEWQWVNEVWEGWRINDDIYLGIQPIAVQRNEMTNLSSCKLGINGRRFSDEQSDNISILSLGIPYQMMFIILNYRIELTIAKSRGKILLLDKNTLGDGGETSDEKTFYYAEALGYLLLDRSNDDVDRTWNQYTVQDMSLFDSIQQLIQLANFYKDSWDELLGINRQRKGAANASDGLGVTEEAIFRSSIISDIIFSTFDEFVESELQGLLDLSKFAWIDGKKGYYRTDDGQLELFNLEPEDFAHASMGVYVDIMSKLAPKLELMKQQINAIAQRKDIKLSTIADLIFTDSFVEMKAKLKKAEAIEAEMAQKMAENEQAGAEELERIRKDYMKYEKDLDLMLQERDWDRKDNNEYIKGDIAAKTAPSGAIELDIVGMQESSNKRLAEMNKSALEREKIYSNERIAVMKDQTEQKKIAASLKNKVSGEK